MYSKHIYIVNEEIAAAIKLWLTLNNSKYEEEQGDYYDKT